MKINQRGQSALEYLMTYGWALVVIVIVVAALVLLVGNPSATDACSAPGTGISISNQNYVFGAANAVVWTLKISNITGKPMGDIWIAPIPVWGGLLGTPVAAASDVAYGGTDLTGTKATANPDIAPGAAGTMTVDLPTGATATLAGQKQSTTISLNWNDGDFDRVITFNCNGTA